MAEENDKFCRYLWGGIFCVAAFVAGLLIGRRDDPFILNTVLEAMTAVGTVGAVIVACFVPFIQDKFNRKQELLSAITYSETIQTFLTLIQLRLSGIMIRPALQAEENHLLTSVQITDVKNLTNLIRAMDFGKLRLASQDGEALLRKALTLLESAVCVSEVQSDLKFNDPADAMLGKALEALLASETNFDTARRKFLGGA